MSTIALLMMIPTVTVVTFVTVYFFWKVLKTPPKTEPDSYYENNPAEKQ
jgi:heme/copper-type cytochrome/quinol oxidase subunit 2